MDVFGTYLRRHAVLENVNLQVVDGRYDDLPGDLARFAAAGVDAALVMLLFDNLMPSFEAQIGTLADLAIAGKRDELRARLDVALGLGSSLSTIVLFRFHRISRAIARAPDDRVARVLADFNAVLEEAAARFRNVQLQDVDDAIAAAGGVFAFDWRFYFRGKAPYAPALLDELARSVVGATRAFGTRFCKALVLDCDNTLWGGVVGEDLPAGIKLDPFDYPGNVYWRIQNEIAALERRGVLVCLCSKNNPADVDEVLADHPHMVLRNDVIAIKAVNWDDKPANLRRIAAELNIGLDSMVFVDDSEFECEFVRSQLPMVRTFAVPAVLSEYPRAFDAVKRLFAAAGPSADGASKTAQYRARAAAQDARGQFASQSDYLASLGLKVVVSRNARDRSARIAELTLKSNQFNVTTRRYSEARILHFMQDPAAAVYSFSVSDKFGDAGLTGVAIVGFADATVTVDTFLMSCRVIGRGVEAAAWAAVLTDAAQRGATTIRAEYVPTPKNALVADWFERMGLAPAAGPPPAQHYQSELAVLRREVPDWIEVIHA